jgi:hypothetical protein
MLSQTFGAIQAGLNRLESQVDGGTAQSEARLVSTGVQALGALANVTASNDQMATSASDSFSGSMASLAANAESTFNTQTAQVTQQTQSTRDGGIAGLQQAVAGFETEATRITTNVETALNNSLQELNRSLQESKAGMDDEAHGIPKQAREAASHEAPAWKTVVKWVLIIAIIVVVAVVAGPAVIGAIGGAAAALGASAGAAAFIGAVVGGAIVGAATSAAIQVLNNWETNQGFGKGVLRAAAIGALTGAIGGAAGFGVGKLMENAGRLTQFGANLASDAVLEVGTELVQGDLSWDNFGQAMVMTLFTAGLGEFGPVRRMQARATHAGASSVPGGRAAAYAESIRPRTAAETEGAAPAAPRPEAEGAAPAAPRPEAEGAAPAAPRPEAEGAAPAAPRPEAEGAAPAAPRPEAEGAAPAAPRQEAEGGASRLGDEMSSTRTEAKVESTAPRSSIEPEAPKTSSEAEAETGKPRGEAEEGAGSSRGSHEDDPAAGRRPVGEEDVTAGQRVVAEVETVGGHRLKILEDGTVAICTTCTTLKLGYGPELARRPDLRRRLGAAQRVKDGRARAERIKDIHRELVIERIRGVPGEIQIDPRTKEYLRKRTPSTEVQNRVNAGEAVDAVYGHKVNGTLAADHIVPFNDLISMPGFTRLSLDNQLKILNDVHNFVGLDPRVNSSKGAKSWADWQGHPDFGQITPSMRRRFRARELRTRNRLQEKINDLLLQQEGI